MDAETRVLNCQTEDDSPSTDSELVPTLVGAAGHAADSTQSALSLQIDGLAAAYRAGQASSLADLHAALWPVIRGSLIRAARLRPLPAPLETDDLAQQSWLLLADLVGRWRPEQGPFVAYVGGAFPWALRRYLRSQAADRRSRKIRVYSAEHADLVARADEHAGADGREWDALLACQEVLELLCPLYQEVLRLHFGERRPPSEVARAVGVAPDEVERLVKRAVRAARSAAAGRQPPDLAADLRLLVEALHLGAGPAGQVMGRAWVCARTSLSELRLARLMRLLVEAGCVVGRTARQAGRLAHPTAEETLRTASAVHSPPPVYGGTEGGGQANH